MREEKVESVGVALVSDECNQLSRGGGGVRI